MCCRAAPHRLLKRAKARALEDAVVLLDLSHEGDGDNGDIPGPEAGGQQADVHQEPLFDGFGGDAGNVELYGVSSGLELGDVLAEELCVSEKGWIAYQ